MNPQPTVLVTAAGSLLGQGILRALRASSLRFRIIAVDPNPLSAGLYWADAAHLIPMATKPGYLASIGAIFAQEKPDAVLIGTDVELGVFAKHRERIEREFSTNVIVSDPRVVAIADDKWKSYSVEMTLRRVLLGEHVVQPRIKPVVVLRHWEETVLTPDTLLSKDNRRARENVERAGRFDGLRAPKEEEWNGVVVHAAPHASAPGATAPDEASTLENG